ncbi:hypothetical protein T4A_3554, partial [Trichinella pseudospiralis]
MKTTAKPENQEIPQYDNTLHSHELHSGDEDNCSKAFFLRRIRPPVSEFECDLAVCEFPDRNNTKPARPSSTTVLKDGERTLPVVRCSFRTTEPCTKSIL